MSENKFRSGFVPAGIVLEAAAFVGLLDGPAGEYLGDLGNVALRVASVDTERVQFQQLTAVVFVQPAIRFALRIRTWLLRKAARTSVGAVWWHRPVWDSERTPRVRSHTQPVIKVEQHRRTLGRRDQQIFELAEHVRADRVLLVVAEEQPLGTLAGEHVEMVEPEIGHHLLKL